MTNMFWDNPIWQEKIFNLLKRIFKYDKRMALLPVDFEKPWWFVLWQQKWLVLINVANLLIANIVISSIPYMLGWLFGQGRVDYMFYYAGFLILARVLVTHLLFYFDPILRLQTMDSVETAANQFFLTVDPIYHSTRSSGQIISKINRGSSGFENIIDIFIFNFLALLGSILSNAVIFSRVGLGYGAFLVSSVVLIIAVNIFLYVSRFKLLKPVRIKFEDKAKAINIESMQQAPFVRAAFATDLQTKKIRQYNHEAMSTSAVGWRATGYVVTISQVIFYFCLGVLGYMILTNSQVDKVLGLTLMIGYAEMGSRLFFIGQNFSRFLVQLEGITDLFEFIRGFGKQTYPVLQTTKLKTNLNSEHDSN